MGKVYSAEELIINDSFIHYCHQVQPDDAGIWENYLIQNPLEKETVEEAKYFVLNLCRMLKSTEKDKALDSFKKAINARKSDQSGINELNVRYINPEIKLLVKKRRLTWYAAASVLVIAAFTIWIFSTKMDQYVGGQMASAKNTNGLSHLLLAENEVARTSAGERKQVILPDGTKVTMNVKSVLSVDNSFGKNTRLVKLEGEAFFDVAHDNGTPFIVQLKGFNIKVLGTMFNVRSYSEDENSETALVKGEVEIVIKNNSHKRLKLKPNQKAILSNAVILKGELAQDIQSTENIKAILPKIKPLTISDDGNSIIETAWIQSRLEITDETFAELKNKLERWYGITITFVDEEVKRYRFTATFKGESIDQALKAMQFSYHFNYNKKGNQIMILK